MEEERLSPELAERMRQATDIDWSRVTPDMFVPSDLWAEQMRAFVQKIMQERHARLEQLIAAVILETGWFFEEIVLVEQEVSATERRWQIKHITELPANMGVYRPMDWALPMDWPMERLMAHLAMRAIEFEDSVGLPPRATAVTETRQADGRHTWGFLRA